MRIIHVKYGPDALTALLASGYATRETQARDMLTAIGGQLLSINWTISGQWDAINVAEVPNVRTEFDLAAAAASR